MRGTWDANLRLLGSWFWWRSGASSGTLKQPESAGLAPPLLNAGTETGSVQPFILPRKSGQLSLFDSNSHRTPRWIACESLLTILVPVYPPCVVIHTSRKTKGPAKWYNRQRIVYPDIRLQRDNLPDLEGGIELAN